MRKSLIAAMICSTLALLILGALPLTAAPSPPPLVPVRPLSASPLPPLVAPSLAYDAKDGYLVLFGGINTGGLGNGSYLTNGTWIRAGGNWTQLHPARSPPARGYAPMVYDAKDGYILLFGGEGASGHSPYALNDSWKFVNGSWTQLVTSTAPQPQLGASMAFDAKDGQVIFFGGERRSSQMNNDTWRFVGGVWTKFGNLATSPPARKHASMAYDAKNGYVLLFGGWGVGRPLNDLWAFSLGTWSNLTPAHAPSNRLLAAMAFDARDGYVVLFGGLHFPHWRNDTWKLDAGTWTQLHPITAPPPAGPGAFAYNPKAGADMLVQLNTGGNPTSDVTWGFSAGNWTIV